MRFVGENLGGRAILGQNGNANTAEADVVEFQCQFGGPHGFVFELRMLGDSPGLDTDFGAFEDFDAIIVTALNRFDLGGASDQQGGDGGVGIHSERRVGLEQG